MSTVRRVHYTYAECLALEEESSVRHEYLDGEIYAMDLFRDRSGNQLAVFGNIRPDALSRASG